ncbi:Versicolorin B desaturase 4 [Paraphaeosphaeria sporulosa]
MRLLPLSKDLLHFELSTETLVRRCQQQLDYTGILNEWPTAEKKGVLDREDLELNAPLLIGAGSETTATTMSGATLALVETRLIMARLLFEFDVTLMPESGGWSDQRSYAVWEKPPLMAKLRPVQRV